MTTEGIIKRFWTFVEKTGGCWNWKGSKTTTGYGNFRYGHDERIKAHRYTFFLYTGKFPMGFILHRCDNPLCVNPKHLYEGTAKQNSQDMVLRNRHANQKKTHCPHGHLYSQENTYVHKNGSRRCVSCSSDYHIKIKSGRPIVWQK
jgi:hypothetical protein